MQLLLAVIKEVEQREGRGGMFDGVVLWKEENYLASFSFLFPPPHHWRGTGAAQYFLEVAFRQGALLKAQRLSAVRLGAWEMGMRRGEDNYAGGGKRGLLPPLIPQTPRPSSQSQGE